ncbi:MAG: succinate dehydrogenase assembly factor 2 [Alphaproteobacteria bacterium]|nr:succinate dehydrogenase assembly factor 2 [Alphaproteobacteria bacterium]
MNGNIEKQRRRLYFRAWHRGMKEMDLILGAFADQNLAQMSGEELFMFESVIALPDDKLFAWITGCTKVPESKRSPILDQICLKAQHQITACDTPYISKSERQ